MPDDGPARVGKLSHVALASDTPLSRGGGPRGGPSDGGYTGLCSAEGGS